MVEEVAEKAANAAVEKMQLQIKIELLALEKRIAEDVSETIDNRLHKALGMSPQDHIIQHDQMRRAGEFFGSFQTAFWKRALLIIVFGALAFFGGYAADFKMKSPFADTQAITREEHQPSNQDFDDAPTDPKL